MPITYQKKLRYIFDMLFTHPDIAKPVIIDYLESNQEADIRVLEYAQAAGTGMIL